MRQKTVLVVENEVGLRTTYATELMARGFDVYSVATVKEARNLINELGERIDVALLDMRLETDPDEPGTTGADLGLELKRVCANTSPEFLIRSGFAEVRYLELALELGAAAFLSKKDSYLDDLIRLVRALLLRHNLKVENPAVIDELNRIAATSKTIRDSIKSFCEQILAPNLSGCLGTPFILLLTDEFGTQIFDNNTGLPSGYDRAYQALQAITHRNADPSVLYAFDQQDLSSIIANQEDYNLEKLEGSVFVSLASTQGYRLSLGILKSPPEERYPEKPYELAEVITQYVRPVVCDSFILTLASLVTAQLDTKRKTTLNSMSQFCLFLGQDQLAMLNEGVATGELLAESAINQRLRLMAEDMEETGTILMEVSKSHSNLDFVQVDMPEFIAEVWANLKDDWGLEGISFKLNGKCSLMADEQDLYIIVARVLQWLSQRSAATEPPQKATIIVSCGSDAQSAHLIFEDRSRRLPTRLRERLFEPFTLAVPSARSLVATEKTSDEPTKESRHRPAYLPLYLAKILVEEKYHGSLEDKSEEIEGVVGHRLVMQLPQVPTSRRLNSRQIRNDT